MNRNLLVAIICISDILRNKYGLSKEETIQCLDLHRDMLIFNTSSKENIELFEHTDYRTWAKIMYDYYIEYSLNNSAKMVLEPNK